MRTTIEDFKNDIQLIHHKLDKLIDTQSDFKVELTKNRGDIDKMNKQININNGDICIKTRLTDVENVVDKHSKYFWGFGIVAGFIGFLIANFKDYFMNK